MVRGKRLYLTSLIALFAVVALMATAAFLSGWGPRGISHPRPLSDVEKARAIDIAFATDEASAALDTYDTYTIRLGWVILERDRLVLTATSYDYDALDTALARMSDSSRLYVQVEIAFGDPARMLYRFAVNHQTGAVARVGTFPLKEVPGLALP